MSVVDGYRERARSMAANTGKDQGVKPKIRDDEESRAEREPRRDRTAAEDPGPQVSPADGVLDPSLNESSRH
jgi:hypothetical protein